MENQNFEVAEEQKRDRQFQDYINRAEPTVEPSSWTDCFNPYLRNFGRTGPKLPVNERARRGKSILHPKKPSHSHHRAGSIANQIEQVVSATNHSHYYIFLQFLQTLGTGRVGDVRSAIVAGPLGTMRRFMGMDQRQEDVPLMTLNNRHTMNLTDISQPL
jgi:hypothetical protein